ncbi:YbjN domain-containing protein [Paraburkholderia sp. Clong3]|uniref:YbjN domain-containing protein n=1 Tax=Paraburkholderia sp. Clong3 TaxID=2991061 RepID=UPI003D1BDDC1
MWIEEEVNLDVLAAHISDSGLDCTMQTDRIVLHSESGIAYQLILDENRKFVRFMTFFPVAPHAAEKQKRDFEHRLNMQVFMASFSVDDDNDLVVHYPLPYGHGLIAGQFMAVLHRFASMLEFVIGTKNKDGLILFGSNTPQPEENDDNDPDPSRDPTDAVARLLN